MPYHTVMMPKRELLHPQHPDGSLDQPASPPAAARRLRLSAVGIAVVFVLMLAIGTLPAAWATPGPDNGTAPTPTPGTYGPIEMSRNPRRA